MGPPVKLVTDCENERTDRRKTGSGAQLCLALLGLRIAVMAAGGAEARFDLTLHDGWNFVSVPIAPVDAHVRAVFGTVCSGGVWGWDGQGYVEVEQIEPGEAYWVYCVPRRTRASRAGVIVTIDGTPAEPGSAMAAPGWNAVGPLPDYMRSGDSRILGRMWGWNAPLQQFQSATGSTLTPGQGYLMYARSAFSISFRAHRITGTIVGDVVEGVGLALTGKTGAQTASNADGSFGLENVPWGNYELTPSAAGVAFVPSSVPVVLDGTDVYGITFTSTELPAGVALIDPGVGATVRVASPGAAVTVPAGALVSADGPVQVTVRSLEQPSIEVAASATAVSAAALLELPAEAVSGAGAGDTAYAFEVAISSPAGDGLDDRYALGCVRIGFHDKDDAGNTYFQDVYAVPVRGSLRESPATMVVRVPTADVARIRGEADLALGEARFADGRVEARFEAAVVDVSGYFGQIAGQATAAGATVHVRQKFGLDRDVEVFLLRWNSVTRAFDSSQAQDLAEKRVVVFIHGWQSVAGFGSDAGLLEPHRSTWQHLAEYLTDASYGGVDLRDTCELYTVRYDSDQGVYDNAGAVWQAMAAMFPGSLDRPRGVTVVAHGVGGVMAHCMYKRYLPTGWALVNWPSGGVERVVALNTPFHGTPLLQMLHRGMAASQAAVVVPSPLAFLACGTPGSMDLAWDEFDGDTLTSWGNDDLAKVNARWPQDHVDAYATYSTSLFAARGVHDAALEATGARIRAVFGDLYDNDGVVPVQSARLYGYDDGYVSRTTEEGADLGAYNHLQVYRGKESGDLNGDQIDETLYAAVAASMMPAPTGMALVPAGSFEMGNVVGDTLTFGELPVHTVRVSAFYMDRTQVTNEQMRAVLQWAYDRGKITAAADAVRNAVGDQQLLLDLAADACQLLFDDVVSHKFVVNAGQRDVPCVEVTWYGAAAYANYRSEMESKAPCFDFSNWSCDFSENGYRLPTEAEWERAARGELVGKRFPWGDTITHEQANYRSIDDPLSQPYDISPTRGLHPDQAYIVLPTGVDIPIPASAWLFPANRYGLHGMAGNVWEWCYDWYGFGWYDEPDADADNTTGPASGSSRVNRGGSAVEEAKRSRCSSRSSVPGSVSHNMLGFRVVLPFTP